MQLKIIIQNKLKSPEPFFLKNILVFFPEVAFFFVCAHVLLLPLPCSTSWFFSQLKEDCSDWFSVCCRVYGERAKKEIFLIFFFPLLSSWYEGRVKGWMWQCWFPLPWDMSWHVVGLCADTWAPCASIFQAASPLWCEQKAIRVSLKNLVKQVENVILFFCCWTLLPPWLHLPVLAGICREKRNPQGLSCCFRSSSQNITPVKSGLFAEICLNICTVKTLWKMNWSNYWGETLGPGAPRAAWWGKSP